MKRTKLILVLFIILLVLTACDNEKLTEEAQTAVDAYNAAVASYNESIIPYNDAISQIQSANEELQAASNAAQEVINAGEDPYDISTLETLKTAMSDAGEATVGVPSILEAYEEITIPEDAKRDEIQAILDQATAGAEKLASIEIPSCPEVPDYSEVIASIKGAQQGYENSIQSLRQITAPSDEFVMERLQRVDTITEMGAVTEDHDPNQQLNKQGGYIGCIYFTDSQVDRSELYIEEGEDNVIDVGTEGGGAIEIFATAEEAKVRESYLASFDGMGMFASGSHHIEGTCLIRTSIHLTASQQNELTAKITEALITVD